MASKSNRQHEIDTFLAPIRKSAELTVFFDRLYDVTKPYWKLFFAHRDILLIPLPIKGQVLPLVCWVSPNYRRRQAKFVEQPVDTTVQLAKARGDILAETIRSLGPEIKQILTDLTLFYMVQFVRANPGLKELVQSEDFDFKKMKQVIGDVSDLNTKVFGELAPFTEAEDYMDTLLHPPQLLTDDSALASSITRLFRVMASGLTAYPEIFMEMPQALLWASILPLHNVYGQWMLQYLETMDLDYDEYSDIISEVFNLELVNAFHNAFWCTSGTHLPLVLTSASKMAPPRHSIKCPICNQALVTSILYRLDDFLFDAIRFRDGLLAIAIAQLLAKNNQKYVFGYQVNDAEIDFLCERPGGNIVLETKVHRTDVDSRQLADTLRGDIIDLGRNLKKLLDLGEKIDKSYLVVNFDTSHMQDMIDNVLRDSAVRSVWRELSTEVRIIGPLHIKETLSQLGIIQK